MDKDNISLLDTVRFRHESQGSESYDIVCQELDSKRGLIERTVRHASSCNVQLDTVGNGIRQFPWYRNILGMRTEVTLQRYASANLEIIDTSDTYANRDSSANLVSSLLIPLVSGDILFRGQLDNDPRSLHPESLRERFDWVKPLPIEMTSPYCAWGETGAYDSPEIRIDGVHAAPDNLQRDKNVSESATKRSLTHFHYNLSRLLRRKWHGLLLENLDSAGLVDSDD